MITNLRIYIRELLQERFSSQEIEEKRAKLFKVAVAQIDKHLLDYSDCKIGKTSRIDQRFDVAYQKDGYIDIIYICNSNSKVSIDKLEVDLIKHYNNNVSNIQHGGGRKSYTGDYWIYIVHKGLKSR